LYTSVHLRYKTKETRCRLNGA